MLRAPHWPCFLAGAFACSLSVDDPSVREPERRPPVGNPFASTLGSPRSFGGSGGRTSEPGGSGGEDPNGGSLNLPDPTLPDAAPSVCAGDAGACDEALCLSNDDCHAGLCVNSRCRSYCAADADCPAGQACALGLCRTSPSQTWQCFVAEDCSPGEDCVSGGCLRRCSDDAQCGDSDGGVACSFGYCGA
jgi:hypothetical protein